MNRHPWSLFISSGLSASSILRYKLQMSAEHKLPAVRAFFLDNRSGIGHTGYGEEKAKHG